MSWRNYKICNMAAMSEYTVNTFDFQSYSINFGRWMSMAMSGGTYRELARLTHLSDTIRKIKIPSDEWYGEVMVCSLGMVE